MLKSRKRQLQTMVNMIKFSMNIWYLCSIFACLSLNILLINWILLRIKCLMRKMWQANRIDSIFAKCSLRDIRLLLLLLLFLFKFSLNSHRNKTVESTFSMWFVLCTVQHENIYLQNLNQVRLVSVCQNKIMCIKQALGAPNLFLFALLCPSSFLPYIPFFYLGLYVVSVAKQTKRGEKKNYKWK